MESKNEIILEALRFRHACKKFDPSKRVSDEDFNTILQAARLAPTSHGFEPWKMIVVQDQALKDKIFPIAWGTQNIISGASHFVIFLAREKADTQYNSDYITHMMRDIQNLSDEAMEKKRKSYQNFQESGFHLLDSDRALFDWACKQAYIVLSFMLMTAAYLGIDSCPSEGFYQETVTRVLVEEGLIDPEHFGVAVMAGFGYRGEEPRHGKVRQPLDDLIIWK